MMTNHSSQLLNSWNAPVTLLHLMSMYVRIYTYVLILYIKINMYVRMYVYTVCTYICVLRVHIFNILTYIFVFMATYVNKTNLLRIIQYCMYVCISTMKLRMYVYTYVRTYVCTITYVVSSEAIHQINL